MNLNIFLSLNNLAGRSALADQLIIFCAVYLGWFILVGLIWYFYLQRHKISFPVDFLVVAASGFLSWAITGVIKYNFVDPRPFALLAKTNTLFFTGGVDSFPSAHTALFFGLAIALFLRDKKWGSLCLVLAALVAISRVIAGVHWPVDIVGGLAIALICGLSMNFLFNNLFGQKRF